MFSDFFFLLREKKIPVSITEYLSLIEALDKKLVNSPVEFYHISRSLLVKDEKYYDIFDQVFLSYFDGVKMPPEITEELKKWLDKPLEQQNYDDIPREWLEMLQDVDLQNLKDYYEQMLKKQREEHNGGSRFIGTRGTSPVGWGGEHPGGMRVGGFGGLRMASKIAQRRHFRNYRSDKIIDTRQFKVALKKLRKLNRIGAQDELDIDETIDKTCKNCGDIELIFHKRKKNNIKLLLLMDVGGSMEPFANLVSTLFSAAHSSTHFKDFKYYYFHNVPYSKLYKDIELESFDNTTDVLRKYDSEYRVIFVGDAAMSPTELSNNYGAIHFWEETYTPGIVWLQRIKDKFPKSIWLNPEVISGWKPYTREVIEQIFPMFDLSIDGLEDGIKALI